MSQVLAIAAGGAIGAVLRYGLARWVQAAAGIAFPVGTLVVNVAGSLAMGFCAVWLLERSSLPPEARLFLLTGVLGGFTTFSAFSVETMTLVENRQVVLALGYAAISVLACVGAAWIGMTAGRQ